MPCSVRTLKPCRKGGVSRPATSEFLETKMLQGLPTLAPSPPLTARYNYTLSQRYGSAIIP